MLYTQCGICHNVGGVGHCSIINGQVCLRCVQQVEVDLILGTDELFLTLSRFQFRLSNVLRLEYQDTEGKKTYRHTVCLL